MVVLLVVAALYVTISFGDPGYVLTGPSAFSPEPATLASMAVPLMLQTCEQCGVPKPPRAKHCYDCGRCVRRMDHHCWWLGNCVGEETHRLFLFYLTAQSVLLWWTCVCAVCGVVGDAQGKGRGPVPSGIAIVAGVLCGLVTLLIGLAALTLLIFQCVLLLRGETTWEHLRREQLNHSANLPPQLRPYDRGALRNVLSFCGCTCTLEPQPPPPFPPARVAAAASELKPSRAPPPLASPADGLLSPGSAAAESARG